MTDPERSKRLDAWLAAGHPARHREMLKEAAARNAPGSEREWHVERTGDQARARADAWQAIQAPGGCVMLLGRRGTGKTQLAVELALQAARKGLARFTGSQRYHVLGELFRDEKRTFDRAETNRLASPLDAAAAVELLVLDEIQERLETAWEDRELTMLFDRRYRDLRRTILLANLTVSEAPKRLPASMWSRIVESGVVIECGWQGFRAAGR